MASDSGSVFGVENYAASGSAAAFSGSETTTSTSIPARRGPAIVSSDEESEPEQQPIRPLRAPSRTPSWAKSSVSPSPEPNPIQQTQQSESNAGSQDTWRRRASSAGSSRNILPVEPQGSGGERSIVSDIISETEASRWGSVFESDSEHESDSGESGRIRSGRQSSPSRSLLSLSGSEGNRDEETTSSSDSEGDLEDEPALEVDLSIQQSPLRHDSIDNGEEHGRKTPSRSQKSGDSGEEEAPFHSPGEYLRMPDTPSETDPSVADTEGWHSAMSETRGGSDMDTSDEGPKPSSAVQDSKSRKSRPVKVKGRRRGKQVDKFNPGYVKLLNEEIIFASSYGIKEFRAGVTSSGEGGKYSDEGSLILGSMWTMYEKDMFFKHLSVVGKGNVPELARRIGTKSIVECRAYLKALQDGREDDMDFPITRSSRGRDLVSSKDLPAAVELSDECVDALEEEADALETRTLKDEERREKVKWGEFWLLESSVSKTIENLYKKKDIERIRSIAPEAELLNTYNMLELSESIFMNGSGDNNWQYLSAEPPSIRRTALTDIHTLVVSLTRRIVQTTLFMAMSRLRGMESKVFGQQKQIRPVDVEAAINCLRLPENSKEFWLKIPRRVGLHVYKRKEDIRKKSCVGFIPYDELEQLLGGSRLPGGSFSSLSSRHGNYDSDDEAVEATMDLLIASAYMERKLDKEVIDNDDLASGGDPMDTETSGLETDTDLDDNDNHDGYGSINGDAEWTYRGKFQKKRDARVKALDHTEDLFMEAMDQRQSFEAEGALWEMMGKEPSKNLPRETGELPKAPPQERKRPSEVLDWRDSMGYLASWETIKRRKIEHRVEKWGGEGEGEEGEGEGEGEGDVIITSDTHPAAPLPKLHAITEPQKRRANPRKPAAKNSKHMKVKESPIPTHSPRSLRVRRKTKVYSGFVSTVENVVETDEEALVRERQVDNSPSSEDHED